MSSTKREQIVIGLLVLLLGLLGLQVWQSRSELAEVRTALEGIRLALDSQQSARMNMMEARLTVNEKWIAEQKAKEKLLNDERWRRAREDHPRRRDEGEGAGGDRP